MARRDTVRTGCRPTPAGPPCRACGHRTGVRRRRAELRMRTIIGAETPLPSAWFPKAWTACQPGPARRAERLWGPRAWGTEVPSCRGARPPRRNPGTPCLRRQQTMPVRMTVHPGRAMDGRQDRSPGNVTRLAVSGDRRGNAGRDEGMRYRGTRPGTARAEPVCPEVTAAILGRRAGRGRHPGPVCRPGFPPGSRHRPSPTPASAPATGQRRVRGREGGGPARPSRSPARP